MKKVIALLLAMSSLISLFSACAVITKPLAANAEYFAYTDKTDATANAVFVKTYGSYKDVDAKFKKHLTVDNQLPILDLTELFYGGPFDTPQKRELRYNQLLYTLSKYEKRVLAVNFGSYSERGISKEDALAFINYAKPRTPRIKLFTTYEKEGDKAYYDLFDGVILSDTVIPENVPEGKELWLRGPASKADAFAAFADKEKISGIIIDDKETERTKELAALISDRKNLDFKEINKPTFEHMCFFFSEGWFTDTKDNYEEIASLNMCNAVTFMSGGGYEEQIKRALDLGYEHVMLYMNYFLTKGEGNVETVEAALRNNKEVFDKYRDHIIFYCEEPVVQKIPEENFRYATRRFREEYPDVMMLACMGTPAMEACMDTYFEYCTDLCYDHYVPMTKEKIESDVRLLINMSSRGQRLWLVPWACGEMGLGTEDRLLENLNICYELLQEYDRIVGLFPFAYEHDRPSDGRPDVDPDAYGWGAGLEDFFDETSPHYMPRLKAKYEEIGRDLFARRQQTNK